MAVAVSSSVGSVVLPDAPVCVSTDELWEIGSSDSDATDFLTAFLAAFLAGFASAGTASLGYGVFTLGTSESNLSVGVGYGFFSGEFSKSPVVMISGTRRLGNNIAFLSENYIIPNYLKKMPRENELQELQVIYTQVYLFEILSADFNSNKICL